MLNRTQPQTSPNQAFTELDQFLLYELIPDKAAQTTAVPLAHYIVKFARLGGHLVRTHDPPPSNTVIWRGLSRLTDIGLGIMIGVQLAGNWKLGATLTPKPTRTNLSAVKNTSAS
jgi:hypothetical protein